MFAGELRNGMLVKISEECPRTKKTVSVISEMKKYLGTIQPIESLFHDTVTIKGFTWHVADLSLPDEKPIDKTPKLFDPENIC